MPCRNVYSRPLSDERETLDYNLVSAPHEGLLAVSKINETHIRGAKPFDVTRLSTVYIQIGHRVYTPEHFLL